MMLIFTFQSVIFIANSSIIAIKNSNRMYQPILIFQGIFNTLFCSAFLWMTVLISNSNTIDASGREQPIELGALSFLSVIAGSMGYLYVITMKSSTSQPRKNYALYLSLSSFMRLASLVLLLTAVIAFDNTSVNIAILATLKLILDIAEYVLDKILSSRWARLPDSKQIDSVINSLSKPKKANKKPIKRKQSKKS